jgi:glycerophosphoryl diester phosphodiesterase
VFNQLNKPTIFAHRGASAYAPENTIAAFELAVHQGADAIELDAKLSYDQHVVVIHDQSVDRTTNGKGQVSDLTLSALKELDAGIKFDESFSGEKIPTLNDVLEAIGTKTFINIEITNYSSPWDHLPEKIAETVKYYNLTNRIICSSFNPIALRNFRRLLPDVPLGFLSTPGLSGVVSRLASRWMSIQALHPAVQDTNQTLINKYHDHGLRVHAYTVNDLDKMKQLVQWEIDGFFTDDPLLAHQALTITR